MAAFLRVSPARRPVSSPLLMRSPALLPCLIHPLSLVGALLSVPLPPQGRPSLRDELSSEALVEQLQTMIESLAEGDATHQWVVDATILFTLVVAILLLLPSLVTLVLHIRLVCTGRTFYEWQQMRAGRRPRERAKSLFDYGVVSNLALTLGIYPLLWLLPTRTGIDGNGIFYPEQVRLALR